MEPKFDANIPIPPDGRQRFHFGAMQIGDSRAYEAPMVNSLKAGASQFKRRHPGWGYTTRTYTDGSIRIWRTA